MTVYEAFAGAPATDLVPVSSTPSWRRRYATNLLATDTAAAGLAAVVLLLRHEAVPTSATALAWPALTALTGAYAARPVVTLGTELRRLASLLVAVAAFFAVLTYASGEPVGRSALLVAFPLLAAGSALARMVGVLALSREDASSAPARRVLLVGSEDALVDTVRELRRSSRLGTVVAGLTPAADDGELTLEHDIPVLAGLDRLANALDVVAADTVMVLPGALEPAQMRELSWSLEGTGVQLAVLPGLTETHAHRMSMHVVDGLPVLAVSAPRRSGLSIHVKHGIDRLAAGLLLTAVAPLFVLIAAAVRLTSSGPAVFRQERVGKDGQTFTLYKFRTMIQDAETQRDILLASNEADGPLFKLREDPRVTRVGKLLRRHSLDELPQLFNVLKGEMSLVGPRPPLPVEVAAYSSEVRRRLLVRPGLTGLWQVSGRSDLSWDDSVRLDLRYVDNVSLGGDAAILGRTVNTVVRGSGAY